VPRAHEAALLAALAGRRARPRLDLEEHAVEEAPGAPVPCLEVAAVPEGWNDRLGCKVVFDYAGVPVPEHEAGWCVLESARRLLVRDLAAERAASARLGELGFRRLGAGPDEPLRLEISPRNLPAAVRALLAEGWHVAAEGRRYRPAAAARVRVVSGIDWFDLEGGVEFAGQEVPLAQVLAALRRGDDAVRLGDGSYGMLPEDWLRRLGPLVDLGAAQGGGLRFRRSQAALLDALLASQPGVEVDAAFDQARRALAEFEGVRPQDPPAGFAGALRAYQREGLGWLRFLERFGFGGCLADDMGLGKTVQVLALLASRQAQGRPGSLVVVPRSVVFNWKEEAARFTPALRVLDHTGPDRARSPEGFAGWDVVLATYGTLRRDALLFQQARFDYVVLDEAQAIKNAATDAAKAARLLRGDHRLALSGTPVENHVGELWSLFEFLNPGMLGRSAAFRKGATELDDERRAALARALRPFVLRRTKEQVARDLPPKVEQTIHCELDAEQRRLYEGLRQHYRASLLPRFAAGGGGRLQVLEALLRLRQAACHPELVEGRPGPRLGAKLEALLPRLEELREEGHKALVFSQFTSFLAILRRELDARGLPHAYLDGRTRDRREQVKRFQEDPACGLFLISLKAGGLGLNLTAAEYVFLLDPWWNPAAEAQAVDRAHRLGQQRHVFAYRLIASATVEEKVLELQQRKRALADALLGADKSLVAGLEREDLELLLS